MCNVKLRPHHVLCITFFEGKGYSEEFVEQMTRVIRELKKNPHIQLTQGEDQICAACPNNNEHQGKCFEKASKYDKKVNELCKLSPDILIEWKLLHERVKRYILEAGKLSDVCGDCEWSSICMKIVKD